MKTIIVFFLAAGIAFLTDVAVKKARADVRAAAAQERIAAALEIADSRAESIEKRFIYVCSQTPRLSENWDLALKRLIDSGKCQSRP